VMLAVLGRGSAPAAPMAAPRPAAHEPVTAPA